MLDRFPSRLSRDSNRGSAVTYMTYAVFISTWRKRARVHRFDCAISRNRFSDRDYGYWIAADTYEGALEAASEFPPGEVADCHLCLRPEQWTATAGVPLPSSS